MEKIFSRTGVEVFDLGNGEVVKVGPVEQITKEYLAYTRLYHLIGRQPSTALGVVTGFSIEGDTASLRLLDVRCEGFKSDLEKMILSAGEDIKTLEYISRALDSSLKLLFGPWSKHHATRQIPESPELLIQELLGSLISLWQRAKPEQKKLIDIRTWLNRLTNPNVIGGLLKSTGGCIQLGACHRDFCT